jgi:hypothetical protein
MGEDVLHKDQIKCLTETPQPTNLTTTECHDRVSVINAGPVFLKKRAKPMSEEEVIDKVITANLKPELMWDFILERGGKASTLKEVKQILYRIDRANAHMKQVTENLSRVKARTTKEKRNIMKSKRARRFVGSRVTIMCVKTAQTVSFPIISLSSHTLRSQRARDVRTILQRRPRSGLKKKRKRLRRKSVKKEDLHAISKETKTLSVSIKDEKEFNIWFIHPRTKMKYKRNTQ